MGSPLQQRVVLVSGRTATLPCRVPIDTIQGFTAVHLGAIVATLWVLMLNGVVGFQLLDDGTPMSLGLILLSAAALFIGTGYIALDTAFSYSGHFDRSMEDPNRNIGLYVLYQLAPLVFLFVFFALETVLVLKVLGERKPMRKPLHCTCTSGEELNCRIQFTFWLPLYSLPLDRYSNTSSVPIFVLGQMAR